MAKRKGIRFARLALIAAAAVAIVAIAIRYRSAPSTPAAKAPPPASGDIAQMIPQIEARLREKPDDATGWRMLAMAQFNVARFPDAARSYARAAALTPKDAELWSSLGEALVYAHRNGVDADAAHAFERAHAIDPKEPRARYFLAVRQDIGGDHRGAVDAWIALLHDTPPGAPWEESVRRLVTEVAAREKIDISGRLPAIAPASASTPSNIAGPSGADVARAGIAGPSAADMAGAQRMTPSEQDAMAHGMVDRLAQRLAANPRDADGWIRLMRARLVLGDRPGALKAKADAERVFSGDPATRTRIAEAGGTLGL
jgi:cytochrome c-type biogenesis protein CcmH